MRGLPNIISLFRNKFNKFNNTGARMLESISSYDIKTILKSYFWRENVWVLICVTLQASFHVSRKSVSH